MISSALYIFSGNEEPTTSTNSIVFDSEDPLFQHEGHDHSNASQHMVGTDNFKQWIGQNQFTKTDQVAVMYVLGGTYKKTATQINNIKFQFTSGNIASGVFKIYGIT